MPAFAFVTTLLTHRLIRMALVPQVWQAVLLQQAVLEKVHQQQPLRARLAVSTQLAQGRCLHTRRYLHRMRYFLFWTRRRTLRIIRRRRFVPKSNKLLMISSILARGPILSSIWSRYAHFNIHRRVAAYSADTRQTSSFSGLVPPFSGLVLPFHVYPPCQCRQAHWPLSPAR